jgi:hypothetical protein
MIEYLPEMRQNIRRLESQIEQIVSALEAEPEEPAEQDTES